MVGAEDVHASVSTIAERIASSSRWMPGRICFGTVAARA
jgi:hypothetical protein